MGVLHSNRSSNAEWSAESPCYPGRSTSHGPLVFHQLMSVFHVSMLELVCYGALDTYLRYPFLLYLHTLFWARVISQWYSWNNLRFLEAPGNEKDHISYKKLSPLSHTYYPFSIYNAIRETSTLPLWTTEFSANIRLGSAVCNHNQIWLCIDAPWGFPRVAEHEHRIFSSHPTKSNSTALTLKNFFSPFLPVENGEAVSDNRLDPLAHACFLDCTCGSYVQVIDKKLRKCQCIWEIIVACESNMNTY